MSKFPEHIREAAKALYLTIDDNGKRKYSLQEIADLLQEQCNTRINQSTISRWARQQGWDEIAAKAAAIAERQKNDADNAEDANSEPDPSVVVIERTVSANVDDDLVRKLAQAKRWLIAKHVKLAERIYNEIQAEDPQRTRFIRLCYLANNISRVLFEMLRDIDEPKDATDQRPIVIINEVRGA